MRILKLVTQGESPQLKVVAYIANSLQKERSLAPVSLRQASRFILYQEELKIVFNYKYNHKQALYKDLKVIQSQFSLIANTKAKYSI